MRDTRLFHYVHLNNLALNLLSGAAMATGLVEVNN